MFAGLADLLHVLVLSPAVERARTREGLQPLLKRLRARGSSSRRRDPQARSRLRRAIGLVDRLFPGGPNCYRRVLLEIALDAGAAEEPVRLGFRAGGGARTGHACLESDPTSLESYDAVFTL
jgi:hypothetical protein